MNHQYDEYIYGMVGLLAYENFPNSYVLVYHIQMAMSLILHHYLQFLSVEQTLQAKRTQTYLPDKLLNHNHNTQDHITYIETPTFKLFFLKYSRTADKSTAPDRSGKSEVSSTVVGTSSPCPVDIMMTALIRIYVSMCIKFTILTAIFPFMQLFL